MKEYVEISYKASAELIYVMCYRRSFKDQAEFLNFCNGIVLEQAKCTIRKADWDKIRIVRFNSVADVKNFVKKYYGSDPLKLQFDDQQQPEAMIFEDDSEPDDLDSKASIIFATEEDMTKAQDQQDPEIKTINKIVSKFCNKGASIKTSYWFRPDGTINKKSFSVSVTDNAGLRVYSIDKGTVVPNMYTVIAYTTSGTAIGVPIHKKHKVLLQQIFRSIYVLNTQDWSQIEKYYLPDTSIYNNIDMSGMGGLLNLPKEDQTRLCSVIRYTLDQVQNTTGNSLRFRFKEFKSVNDFTLISDSNTAVTAAALYNEVGNLEIKFGSNSFNVYNVAE